MFFWFKVTPKTTIEWEKKHRKKQEKVMMMVQNWSLNWMVAHATKQQQQLRRLKITTHRVIVATFLFSISFFLFYPKIPRSPTHHQFADLRNLLGKTNFTFYLILWKRFYFSDFGFWVLHRCPKHIECDHKFSIFSCGCSWFSSYSWRRIFYHKVTT